jgi:chromosome segregation ATPase
VDYFTPGLRELGRKLHRLSLRAALWQRRKQLGKAETALGLLGWQQADFDPETQRQVNAINNVEREQGKLINEGAERAATIRRLRSELEAQLREHEEQRRLRAQAGRKIQQQRAEIDLRLGEKRKVEPNFGRRMPELDRELREVMKLLAELLREERQTLKIRNEVTRLRERTVAIPNEKNDLRTQHFRTVTEIRALEEDLERLGQELAAHEQEGAALAEQWSAEERDLAAQIKEEEREKMAAEKRVAELERAKVNPYQQIGQVLALANVPPMNQPHALEAVKELERAVGALRQDYLESRKATAEENAGPLQASYVVLGALALALALIVWAAL